LNKDRDERLGEPREGDLEKAFHPAFEQYEEWRASQESPEPQAKAKGEKKGELS